MMGAALLAELGDIAFGIRTADGTVLRPFLVSSEEGLTRLWVVAVETGDNEISFRERALQRAVEVVEVEVVEARTLAHEHETTVEEL